MPDGPIDSAICTHPLLIGAIQWLYLARGSCGDELSDQQLDGPRKYLPTDGVATRSVRKAESANETSAGST